MKLFSIPTRSKMIHCAKNNIPFGVLESDAVIQKLITEFS